MSSIETPAALVRRPSADILGAVGRFHRVNIPHQAAQPVQLIEQMQNDRNALVVHAEIQPEIRGASHSASIQTSSVGRIKMRSGNELLGLHHHTPIDCRGLYATGCHPATNASSFGSGFSGSISISLTYSSPLLPSAPGR